MSKEINYDISKLTDIIEWDVVNWSGALQFWLENTNLDLPNTKALEIGSRRGGLSIFLADYCNKVICSDLENPKENASKLHAEYDLQNVEYTALNALNFNGVRSKLIVSKSVLGSFEGDTQDAVLENIYNALEEGGEYWFVENLSATILHQVARKLFVKWGSRWNYIPYSELNKKFAKFSKLQIKTAGLLGAFGMTSGQRNFLGKIDQYIFDKITPSKMNYLVMGVATKSIAKSL